MIANHQRAVFLPAAILVLGMAGDSARGAEEIRDGLLGDHKLAVPSPTRSYNRCPPGQFLVGIGETQTDRMIGYWQGCAPAGAQGVWGGIVNVSFGVGASKGGTSSSKTCPPDYYIVGIGATAGKYSADKHGLAKPTPLPLLADLQPVCRQLTGPRPIYALYRAYFEKADDNGLYDVGWGGIENPKSCAAGTAAVGIAFRYDGQAKDPANQFQDAALICDRIGVVPPSVNQVEVPGKATKKGK